MEIHRSARADARGLSACRAAGCGGESACQGCGRHFLRRRLPAAGVRRWRFRAGTVRPEARAGADHRFDGAGAGDRRCARRAACRQDVCDRRRGGGAQHRTDGRRRRHPHCQGCRDQAADPSGVRGRQRQAELSVHPLAHRGGAGRQGDHHRGTRQRSRAGEYRARSGGRRQGAGRLFQADARPCAACGEPAGFGRRKAQCSTRSPSPAT